MSIHLYRRHRPECEGGHSEDSRSGEFEERKKNWRRCDCLIFLSGTLGGKFRRRCTEKSHWDDARAIAAQWEKIGSWEGEVILPPSVVDASEPKRITIETATKIFLDEMRETAAFATHKKYRLFLNRLVVFSHQRDTRVRVCLYPVRGLRSITLPFWTGLLHRANR